MIGWSCHSVVLLVLESVTVSVVVWPCVRGIVGASFGVGGWVGWSGWGIALLEGLIWFPPSSLLDGDIPSSAFLAVREMSFCAYRTTKMSTFPVFGFNGFNSFSGLDALFAVLIVLVFSVGFASTQSAHRDTRFFAC